MRQGTGPITCNNMRVKGPGIVRSWASDDGGSEQMIIYAPVRYDLIYMVSALSKRLGGRLPALLTSLQKRVYLLHALLYVYENVM